MQSLKELWQKTYRGQDIEYIQIKAEPTDRGRSTYDYKVVMVAAGVELDMRGHCSAGQKVSSATLGVMSRRLIFLLKSLLCHNFSPHLSSLTIASNEESQKHGLGRVALFSAKCDLYPRFAA
jgi:hypothetical protein